MAPRAYPPPMSFPQPTMPLPPLGTLILEEQSEDEEHSPTDKTEMTHREDSGSGMQPTSTPLIHVETTSSHYRNRSPYSRGHLRSYTTANSLVAPPMARTRSLPSVTSRGFSPSPSHSPVRQQSPHRASSSMRISPRRSFEEAHPTTTPSFLEIESIAEDSELSFQPRAPPKDSDFQSFADYQTQYHTFPRANSLSRRRPASPLHQIYQPPTFTPGSAGYMASPATTPPPLTPTGTRFNESYPGSVSSISMPSTPTSVRSRSPSISSLGTIPDSPDAEEAAIEEFNIAKLKAAADAADAEAEAEAEAEKGKRRGSGGGLERPSVGVRGGLVADKRKRWSVCGAERRGDFEMETIWED